MKILFILLHETHGTSHPTAPRGKTPDPLTLLATVAPKGAGKLCLKYGTCFANLIKAVSKNLRFALEMYIFVRFLILILVHSPKFDD